MDVKASYATNRKTTVFKIFVYFVVQERFFLMSTFSVPLSFLGNQNPRFLIISFVVFHNLSGASVPATSNTFANALGLALQLSKYSPP